MKKVLIVGENSYIGESFADYVKDQFAIFTLNAQGLKPIVEQFSGYDVVFYVAGIAHRKETKENAHLFYEVNRDLAIEVAKASKEAGVRQFILMSTMAVYGMVEGAIDRHTKPHPATHYGKSKLQADKVICKQRGDDFKVAILRPPMVYGKGCKGNYQKLRRLALNMPFFPKVYNQRSMIYIGNLCEFVKIVIEQEKEGIFFPQNAEYVNTSELMRDIASSHGKKRKMIPGFSWITKLPIANFKKAFGSLTYEQIDVVDKYNFHKSIKETEKIIPKEQINIWIYHHYASTPDRNGYIRPFRFAKHLKKKGVRVVVFASSYHHWADENVIDDGSDYKLEMYDGVPFVFVRTPSSAAGNVARIKNMAAFSIGLEKVAKRIGHQLGGPDMILASSPHPLTMVAGIRIAKKYGIPCICEVRDLWPDAIFAGGRLKEDSVVGKALIAGEYWIYRKANALIFTKEGDTGYLYEKHWMTSQGGKINPEKCFYINNGVDLPLYDEQIRTEIIDDPDLEDDTFKVVYAGAIRPVNDVENIVNAAKFLPRDSNVIILIYGDGNLRESLEKRVLDEKIDNVKFKGYVDQKYIPYILSKSSANLLNYSSTNYTWSRGSSSNKLFEYLASGKPVIATIKTGFSIIEKYDCGLEMENESPEELAKDIMVIKGMNRERYNELCQNARKAAYEFDYEKLTERLWEVIRWVKN